METRSQHHQYVICLVDRGELSVMKGKVYRVVDPDPNDPATDLRIIDEEGEDYPYPREWFGEVQLSPNIIAALEAA